MPGVFTLDQPSAATPPPSGTQDWQLQLRDAVSDVEELLAILGLTIPSRLLEPGSRFRLRVPRCYVDRMRRGDPADPLLLQVLPLARERAANGVADPVGDLGSMPVPGLLHKYQGRALLVATGACAIHCRYCFRRHYPYGEASCAGRQLEDAVAYLARHDEIDEVILSGGDPLVLDDDRLGRLIRRLENVRHLRYLRVHSRLPVVLPARITPGLVARIAASRLRTTFVVHANHANEITQAETRAFDRLRRGGITLLNQSVLLAGINDDAGKLTALSKRLHDNHVLPYYLHLLDPVQGAMHFDVNETRAAGIIQRMRAVLPGYLVPSLVREIPDTPSKTTISVI